MLIPIAVLSVLILLLLALLLAARRSRPASTDASIAAQVEACLPQTQCGKCLYTGCRPYAEAIAAGEADINQCPPGGQDTINTLARLLGRERKPLNPLHGEEADAQIAFIREDVCIGCKLCIKACPVDAILGSAKVMHTVIAAECTGCELCIDPCPVDCIDMLDPPRHVPLTLLPLHVAARV